MHYSTILFLAKIKEYFDELKNQNNLKYTPFDVLSMPAPKNKNFPLLKDGKTEEFYLKHFMRSFRQKNNSTFTIDLPHIYVEVSKNIFKDNFKSTQSNSFFKIKKNNRHLYLNYIADAIKSPQEVWWYEYKNSNRLNFLARYNNNGAMIEVVAVFENKPFLYTGISAYQTKYPNYLEMQRVGERIFFKR